jgi:GNAT superfamily N-acetyltransferase
MHTEHPTGPEHEYLAFLAAQPGRQGKGLESRLLEHHHQRSTPPAGPAVWKAIGACNRRLYERHGYAVLGPYPIADGGPLLYPMWRPARRD